LCVKNVNHYCLHSVLIMSCWNRWYLWRTIAAPSHNNTECHGRNYALHFRTSPVLMFNYHLLQDTCFFDVTCRICFVVLVYRTGRWQSNQLWYTRICVCLWFSLCLYVGAISFNLFVEMTKVVRTVLIMVTTQNTVLSGVHTLLSGRNLLMLGRSVLHLQSRGWMQHYFKISSYFYQTLCCHISDGSVFQNMLLG
jgi:hypothetical protein